MKKLPEVCIAIHRNMLSAALAARNVKKYYSPEETLQAQKIRYQARRAPYPAWYLFGSAEKLVTGLISLYTHQGYTVCLCPDDGLLSCLNSETAVVDVQLCAITREIYALLKEKNIMVSGYLPEFLASKTVQADKFSSGKRTSFLPVQKAYSSDSTPVLPESNAPVWILKYPLGVASRGPEDIPYTVWTANKLSRELPRMLSLLPPGTEIIVSEFLHTLDPFAGLADHVVHKMHFYAAGNNGLNTVHPYGNYCQRFIYTCCHDTLNTHGVLSLQDYIGEPQITTGNIAEITDFQPFTECLAFINTSRLILSVDFIIPVDGIPRFLEINKLGATFAERFDQGLPPIIDFYPSIPL